MIPPRKIKRLYFLSHQAEVCCAQGQYQKAESLYLQALSFAEMTCGREHIEVSTVLNNLAVVYKYLGRFAEAGQLYQRALVILERELGPTHPELATLYHNLGGLEHAAGNFARGEPYARRSVELREKALGSEHIAVAADIAALAALLDGQRKYAEAEQLYRRALTMFERDYGAEHYEIAVNLNNLAANCNAQGRKDEAERLYLRALALKEKLVGAEHPDVAMTLNNLAVFYKAEQRYAEAEALYQRALAIFERALGPQHPKVATCLDNYAGLLRKLGRVDEVQALKDRAKVIRQGLGLKSGQDVAVTATINPQFARFALTVRRSPIHRWGVFAEERIPARRKVIEYTGERINCREAQRRAARSQVYFFTLDKKSRLDGGVGGSGAELINHSCEPNLYSCLVKGHILYFSKREIAPGEELTVDYQFSPKVAKSPCQCGSPKCRGTINLKPDQLARLRHRPGQKILDPDDSFRATFFP